MIDDTTTWIVLGVTALVSVAAWVTLIAVPAWTAYWRVRERVLALVMSVYVFAAFIGMGAGVGALFLYYFDRI